MQRGEVPRWRGERGERQVNKISHAEATRQHRRATMAGGAEGGRLPLQDAAHRPASGSNSSVGIARPSPRGHRHDAATSASAPALARARRGQSPGHHFALNQGRGAALCFAACPASPPVPWLAVWSLAGLHFGVLAPVPRHRPGARPVRERWFAAAHRAAERRGHGRRPRSAISARQKIESEFNHYAVPDRCKVTPEPVSASKSPIIHPNFGSKTMIRVRFPA